MKSSYVVPSTDESYLAACKKRKFTPNSEVLQDGTRAHWVGSSKAEKLILNFHGGGYCFPAGPDMFEFMFQIVDVLQAQGKNVSVLMLSYGTLSLLPAIPTLSNKSQISHPVQSTHVNSNKPPFFLHTSSKTSLSPPPISS
jgi:hypothetical protein